MLAIVLLIFGPRKLPELGQTLGRAMKNFKDGLAGVENATYQKIDNEKPKPEPLKVPVSEATPVNANPEAHS